MDDFTSLLFRDKASYSPYDDSLFCDLHIDQILKVITEGLEEFHLDEFYRQRPTQRRDAEFRTAIARDLWDDGIREEIEPFLGRCTRFRRYMSIADSISEAPARGKWKLDAAVEYVEAVAALCKIEKRPASEGLNRFFIWLRTYSESEAFTCLREAAISLKASIDSISYSLNIDIVNGVIHFGEDTDTADVCADFMKAFDRYDLGNVSRDIAAFCDINMNVLEDKLLAVIQKENPDLAAALFDFCSRFDIFLHNKILAFEREALFYISYIRYAKRLEGKGFPFALPRFTESHRLKITNGYDASLALVRGSTTKIVENDFEILEGERSFLLTGPNQGGKTTFSRMFGQIIFFSSLGLLVPCRDAEILWTNGLKTHFIVEENPIGDSGRLQEELKRLDRILTTTPDKSIVILNELFSSTTTYDALEMGKRTLRMFEEKECICLYVTHLFELAADGGAISLIAEMTADSEPVCTFRIKRNVSVRNAFANRLLAKHRMRSADIKERTYAAFSALL